jgi:hypothetical protein
LVSEVGKRGSSRKSHVSDPHYPYLHRASSVGRSAARLTATLKR